jgi:Rad3-related DNA helicase
MDAGGQGILLIPTGTGMTITVLTAALRLAALQDGRLQQVVAPRTRIRSTSGRIWTDSSALT